MCATTFCSPLVRSNETSASSSLRRMTAAIILPLGERSVSMTLDSEYRSSSVTDGLWATFACAPAVGQPNSEQASSVSSRKAGAYPRTGSFDNRNSSKWLDHLGDCHRQRGNVQRVGLRANRRQQMA